MTDEEKPVLLVTPIDDDGEYTRYATGTVELRVRDVILKNEKFPDWLPVRELWQAFEPAALEAGFGVHGTRDLFNEYLTALGVTSEDVTDCEYCHVPDWDSSVTTETRSEGTVCDTCAEANFTECENCDELYLTSVIERTGRRISGDWVCERCVENDYRYCGACDEWYHEDDAGEHDHDDDDSDGDGYDDGCCKEYATEFRVRNGENTLLSGDKLQVSLPEGIIDEEGLNEIAQLLYRAAEKAGYYTDAGKALYSLAGQILYMDPDWQTKAGNYPKRLSAKAYKEHKHKMTADLLARVGTIAGDHSKAVAVQIEVTRHLNMPASDFYHGDSCWWGGYSYSRCALKSNGGFALRSFRNGYVAGRAFVLPLRIRKGRLTATFDTMAPDALMVFNGYGELSGYAPARIMAQLYGWTYKKDSHFSAAMYINSGGYLVASQDVLAKFSEVAVGTPRHADLYETEKAELAALEAALSATVALEEKETADVA